MGTEINSDKKTNINLLQQEKFTNKINTKGNSKILELIDDYFNKCKTHSNIVSKKSVSNESYDTKVALWHVPSDSAYTDIFERQDMDDSRWLETTNTYGENEFEDLGDALNKKLDEYKVQFKTTSYKDLTYDVESIYPNGIKIREHHDIDYVFINITDKFNRLIAEKIYNYSGDDGRKIIYKNIENEGNIFTIVKIYSYNTDRNRSTDIVNFGYTNSESSLIKGCKLKKQYYLLNGDEVKAKTNKKSTKFKVKDKDGKKLKFKAE